MKIRFHIILLVAILILISLFSIRGLIIQEGTLGHNWDWSVVNLPEQLIRIFENSFFTWSEAALGYPKALALPVDFLNLIFYSWAYTGAGGYFISRLLLFITPVISGVTMFFLLADFFNNRLAAKNVYLPIYFGSILFAFSPFLLGEFIGGAWSQFIAYALMPLPILFWRRARRCREVLWSLDLLLATLTLSLLSISTHVLIIILAILFFYVLFQRPRWLNIKKLAYVLILFFIFNLYWIIPVGLEMSFTESLMSSEQFFVSETLTRAAPNLFEAVTLSGYARPFTKAVIPDGWYPFWLFTVLGFMGYCLYFLLRKPGREKLFWLLIFLGSIVFVTAGRPPLGNFVIWSFTHVPFLSGFRSIQHFIPASALSLIILLSLGIAEIFKKLKFNDRRCRKTVFLLVCIIVLSVWTFPFWSSGDFGKEILAGQGMSAIDSFNLSPGYEKAFWELEKTDGTSRVATLPLSFSPVYLPTEYQSAAQGGDPTLATFKTAPFFADFRFSDNQKKLGEIFERNISDLDLPADKNTQILSFLGVSHLLYRRDLGPNPANYLNRRWYNELITDYLRNSSLEKEFTEDYVDFYNNPEFFPKIYIPSQNILVLGDLEGINYVIEKEGLAREKAIYFEENNPAIPDKSNYDRIYWHSRYNLDEIEATQGNQVWENKQNAKTITYKPGDEDYTNLTYSFSVPRDGLYSLSVKLRYDTDEGGMQIKIDQEEWSDSIHPYFKTPYYTSGKDSWYYQDTYIGDYNFLAGEHTITFRSRPVLEKNLKEYKQGIMDFSLSALLDERESSDKIVPEIEFHKVNPAHYQAKVSGAVDPFYLNFLESYNSNWELRINDKPISADKHFLVNGYGNSWYLEEQGDLEIDIVYKTQEVFEYSAWASGLAVAVVTFLTTSFYIRRRSKYEHAKN